MFPVSCYKKNRKRIRSRTHSKTQTHTKRQGNPRPFARRHKHKQCFVITAARFKIGHTQRKLPVAPTATSRFIAYQFCAVIYTALCSHAIYIIHYNKAYCKRSFPYLTFYLQLHMKKFAIFPLRFLVIITTAKIQYISRVRPPPHSL